MDLVSRRRSDRVVFGLSWYSKGHKDKNGVVTYPNAALVNPILCGLGALFLIYAAIHPRWPCWCIYRENNPEAEVRETIRGLDND